MDAGFKSEVICPRLVSASFSFPLFAVSGGVVDAIRHVDCGKSHGVRRGTAITLRSRRRAGSVLSGATFGRVGTRWWRT
jgi:hypothetical protein